MPDRQTHDRAVNDSDLMTEAYAVRERSYAPYSGFAVGAALATDAGVFTGTNVENAAYGSTICAEAAAVAAARAGGATRLDTIAIAGIAGQPCVPCGNCRQILNEFGDLRVLLDGGLGIDAVRLTDLLPQAFGPDDLTKEANADA